MADHDQDAALWGPGGRSSQQESQALRPGVDWNDHGSTLDRATAVAGAHSGNRPESAPASAERSGVPPMRWTVFFVGAVVAMAVGTLAWLWSAERSENASLREEIEGLYGTLADLSDPVPSADIGAVAIQRFAGSGATVDGEFDRAVVFMRHEAIDMAATAGALDVFGFPPETVTMIHVDGASGSAVTSSLTLEWAFDPQGGLSLAFTRR